MTVIQRHGEGKPDNDKLNIYQMGYDTSDNKYGKHEGKTLFIRDGEGEDAIKDVTQAYLKEEFINYCFATNEDGSDPKFFSSETDLNGRQKPVYEHAEGQINGLVENLTSDTIDIVDESGEKIGQKVIIGSYVVNTKEHKYTDPTQNAIVFYSIDPKYIGKLKNIIEQRAVITVDTWEEMNTRANEMAENKTLESGVQFIVKHDEKNNEDTWLYLVSEYDGTISEDTDSNEDENGVVSSVIKINTNYDKAYKIGPVMPIEYQFHDPVAKDIHETGLTVEIGEKREKENEIDIGLSKTTEDTIICAHDNAISNTHTEFGADVSSALNDSDERVVATAQTARNNKQTYTNYIELYQKIYNPKQSHFGENGSDGTKIREVIDFNNFVLDEGSWDD